MTNRKKFIAGVTRNLGRSEIQVPEADPATAIFEDAETAAEIAASAMADASTRSTDLIDQMAKAAATIGWKVHRVTNPEDAAATIADICVSKDAKAILRSEDDVFNEIPIDAALGNSGVSIKIAKLPSDAGADERAQRKQELFDADVGITGVDYAVAETGTVVLHPRKGLSRLVSLTPPTHIAVLRPGDVLESLDELFAIERADFVSGDLAGSMNLISGPSKTADIEGTIVTGIHGPLEAHLVITENG